MKLSYIYICIYNLRSKTINVCLQLNKDIDVLYRYLQLFLNTEAHAFGIAATQVKEQAAQYAAQAAKANAEPSKPIVGIQHAACR